jgi:peptidyl-prolyl cis-trans isomerase B (cyclophilin B)
MNHICGLRARWTMRARSRKRRKKGACPLNKSNCKADVDKAQQEIDFAKKTYTVEMTTNKGPIRLQFMPDVAPGHVKNFLALCKLGFYDGLIFHRVIEGFMIQGGCPQGTGFGNGGYNIKAEFNATKHVPGVLSMARSNEPNSASTQFFICLETYPSLDRNYTAFGKVMDKESQDTVNAIGLAKTDRNDKPIDKVTIEKAVVKETAK